MQPAPLIVPAILLDTPIPDGFVVSPDNGDDPTSDSGLAVLMNDGYTIDQTQPFSLCIEADNGTSEFLFDGQDLFGDGYYGATTLSEIGGALPAAMNIDDMALETAQAAGAHLACGRPF